MVTDMEPTEQQQSEPQAVPEEQPQQEEAKVIEPKSTDEYQPMDTSRLLEQASVVQSAKIAEFANQIRL